MGVLRSMVSLGAEMEELRRTLRSEISYGGEWKQEKGGLIMRKIQDKCADENRTVCVTSGVSFLGFALVNSLLARGYTVKLTVETQEDLDKLGEMDMFGDARDRVWAVMTNLMNLDSLCCAFDGCVAVFHTSAFTDPSGVSGYSKHMAQMEARVAERVVEGCVRSASVRKCVFTSSLLACVWRRSSNNNNNNNQHFSTIIDENSWTDETLCRDRKLWFALGKTMAEKAAWRAARGRDLKLVTICPALITGPGFCRRSSTSSIAFLKGSQELFAEGLLASVDVNKVAEAHVTVYEAMHDTACGRYICYDHVIRRGEEAIELERQLGIPNRITSETMSSDTTLNSHNWFELSNRKLSRLIFGSRHCSYDIYSMFCT